MVLFIECDHVGIVLAARVAPRSPEIHDRPLATQIRKAKRIALERGQGKIGSGSSDGRMAYIVHQFPYLAAIKAFLRLFGKPLIQAVDYGNLLRIVRVAQIGQHPRGKTMGSG